MWIGVEAGPHPTEPQLTEIAKHFGGMRSTPFAPVGPQKSVPFVFFVNYLTSSPWGSRFNADPQSAGLWLLGTDPVQRLNARVNELGSEKPTR